MNNGFSLIEVVICLAIMSILTCIAFPSYTNYIARAHRIDGETALYDLANRLELYFSTHHSYKNATLGTGQADDVLKTNASPEKFYTLSIKKQTHMSYVLEAEPVEGQERNDKLCQTLTLDSQGITGIASTSGTNPTGTAHDCW